MAADAATETHERDIRCQETCPPRHLTDVHAAYQEKTTVFCSVLNVAKTENRAVEVLHQMQSLDMFYQRLIMTRPQALRARDCSTSAWFRRLEAVECLQSFISAVYREYITHNMCPVELEVCITLQENEISAYRVTLNEEIKAALIRKEDQRARDLQQAREEAQTRDHILKAVKKIASRAEARERTTRQGARRNSF